MLVVKRDGTNEPVSLDKVTHRIEELSKDLCRVDPILVATKVVQSLRPGILTSQLDKVACEICGVMTVTHPQYGLLAGRIARSNLAKMNPKTFSQTMKMCAYQLNDTFKELCESHAMEMDVLVGSSSFDCGYRAYLCLERSYLLRVDGKVVETPEMLFGRVALATHANSMKDVRKMFARMIEGAYIHATPTLFNSGTICAQLSSCFLLSVKSDSIEGIFATLTDCALVSKASGGIGLDFTTVRAQGSHIASTNGVCSGIVPALRIFNAASCWVDQAGRRPGAWAIYVEPWHADILEFLQLRLNQGHDKARARDLFYGIWVPDIFYRRVEDDKDFTLFCPTQTKDDVSGKYLHDIYGDEFEEKYIALESAGKGRKVKARLIWEAILKACVETGACYMMNKDAVNERNPQKNLGTIRCSNLCTEVVLYTSPEETAVCNLATIALPRFVKASACPLISDDAIEDAHAAFDYEGLIEVAGELVRNLNEVVDRNSYPLPEARRSNMRHRPIGIGVQGLGDVFHQLMLPASSAAARALNCRIFEAIYFGAVSASVALAKELGPYPSFEGSPASKGSLQFDLFEQNMAKRAKNGNEKERAVAAKVGKVHLHFDWSTVKRDMAKYGLRNSTLVSPPPTVSTSTILENSETIETPQNMILNKTLSGEFPILNRNLVNALERVDSWTQEIRDGIIAHSGSVAHLKGLVPDRIVEVFQTVWEVSQSDMIEMNSSRLPFIDQSISFNLYINDPTNLTSALFKNWRCGAKGSYYTRTRAAMTPLDFSTKPAACVSCSA